MTRQTKDLISEAIVLLAGFFALAYLITCVTSCGGNPGRNGSSCSVQETSDGALITCEDGSQVELLDARPGDSVDDVIVILCKKNGHGPRTCTVQR